MRWIFRTLLIAACMAQPLLAAGAKEGAPGTNVEMPFLIAPMSKDGKLLGYAYISAKLVASSQSAAIAVRDKLAFIQDAFVRDVNKAPISKADDPTAVDTVLLNDRLVDDARRIVGNNKVVTMVFIGVQFAPLHPGDSTSDLVPPTEKAPGAGDGTATPQPGQAQTPGTPPDAASAATSKPPQAAIH